MQEQEQLLTPLQEFDMVVEEVLRAKKTRDTLIGMKRGIEFCRKRVAKKMLLKLKLDIDTVKKATELPKTELKKILADGHDYWIRWEA